MNAETSKQYIVYLSMVRIHEQRKLWRDSSEMNQGVEEAEVKNRVKERRLQLGMVSERFENEVPVHGLVGDSWFATN